MAMVIQCQGCPCSKDTDGTVNVQPDLNHMKTGAGLIRSRLSHNFRNFYSFLATHTQ